MKSSVVIGGSFLIFTIIYCVVGYFVLPDQLVMQISTGGEPSLVLSKPVGLLIILALGIITSVFVVGNKSDKQYRSYMMMLIMVIVYVLVWVFNL